MTDKMREEFEAACTKHAIEAGYPEHDHGFDRHSEDRNCYSDTHTQAAWWAWQTSREALTTWQPMASCPKHVDVLFFNERNGVIPGRLTDADSFMTDKERDEWDGGEEAQFRIDAFGFGHWGVDRMDGSEAPTQWMPYPEEPEVKP